MLESLLDQLARQRGIGDAYHNYRGDLMWVSRETKKAILGMGCPTEDVVAIGHALHERETARWRTLLGPVAVVHPGRMCVALALAADELDREVGWRIVLEGGEEIGGRVRAGELQELDRGELEARVQTHRSLPLPDRHGTSLLLAIRPWEPRAFRVLRKEGRDPVPAGRLLEP